jgi:hypothetical protein
MGLARSTYYGGPQHLSISQARLARRINEICAGWPRQGYR